MSLELFLPSRLLEQIAAHAERSHPEECCGVLVGHGRRVERIVEADNVAAGNRTRRYVIAPEILLAVHKETRRTGCDVVGYYHSHPSGRASPSSFDLEHAWPGASYLIAALEGARVVEMRSFRLHHDENRFEEERVNSTNGREDKSGRDR